MIVIDTEVVKFNWLFVSVDIETGVVTTIWDSPADLTRFYNEHMNDIWFGYNIKGFDQFVIKGTILGIDPYLITQKIITEGLHGYQISNAFKDMPMIMYDVQGEEQVSLKTLECFMGSDIRETDVPFDIDRPLTEAEKASMEEYCLHDVLETMRVLTLRKDAFSAQLSVLEMFDLPATDLSLTKAQLTAKALGCRKTDPNSYGDVGHFRFLDNINLGKYQNVKDHYEAARLMNIDTSTPEGHEEYYGKVLQYTCEVAGVKSQYGIGGLHAARPHYSLNAKEAGVKILHMDVRSYYPSLILMLDVRTAEDPDSYRRIYEKRLAIKAQQKAAKTPEDKKKYKAQQIPYKLLLNSLSGNFKFAGSSAYDPFISNTMCINGQLILTALIAELEEKIPGFNYIQGNTDGIIFSVPDDGHSADDSIALAAAFSDRVSTDKGRIDFDTDYIEYIYEKDVNSYYARFEGGGAEAVGEMKPRTLLKNDMAIITEALTDYFENGTLPEDHIRKENRLIKFQKVIRLTSLYKCGVWNDSEITDLKTFRVFASRDPDNGPLYKLHAKRGNLQKAAGVPEHCFFINEKIHDGKDWYMECPKELDKQYYIDLAYEHLRKYGVNI